MPFDNKTDPLSLLDDEDDMSVEDEVVEMAIPDGYISKSRDQLF